MLGTSGQRTELDSLKNDIEKFSRLNEAFILHDVGMLFAIGPFYVNLLPRNTRCKDSHLGSSEDRFQTTGIQHHNERINVHIADHDLSKLCFRDVAKLNFLHRYSLPGSPVECTFDVMNQGHPAAK